MKSLCILMFLALIGAAIARIGPLDLFDCDKPPETGRCRGRLLRFYYDLKVGQCKQFIYGGCGGNLNNFRSEEECNITCGDPECPPNKEFGSFGDCPPSCLKTPPPFCTQKLNYGCKCKEGYVLTKYKDYESDCIKPEECPDQSEEPDCPPNKEFGSFGDCPPSCLKNPPPFCTLKLNYGCKCKKGYVLTKYKDYESDCIKPEECPDQSEDSDKNCVDDKETGPCRASVPSWYYNKETGMCEHFIYGGCKGNGNRYRSEEECKNNCVQE